MIDEGTILISNPKKYTYTPTCDTLARVESMYGCA
jgi:hypothetical protein